MSEADYEAAVAASLRSRSNLAMAYKAAARLEKQKTLQQILNLPPTPPM